MELLNAGEPNILAKANNTAITDNTVTKYDLWDEKGVSKIVHTTLAGIVLAAVTNFLWDEKLLAAAGPIPYLSPFLPPALFPFMTNFDSWNSHYANADCAPSWTDPRSYVIAELNEVSAYTPCVIMANH